MKNRLIYLLLPALMGAISMACSAENRLMHEKIGLSDSWKIQSSAEITGSGAVLSEIEAPTDGWYSAKVPGTVIGVLTENGLYQDLFIGKNYEQADKTPFDVSWWYRTEFKLPGLQSGQRVNLEFDGLTYRANVWLNGQLVAPKEEIYGPFCRFSLDVTEYAGTDNVLAVEVFRAQNGEPNIGFVDWNPRPLDENMGIFREVRVVLSGSVGMTNTWVQSQVNTETLDEAWISVETELINYTSQSAKGELKGQIENIRFSVPVTLGAGEKKKVKVTADDIKNLHIKNPRLWWCNNLGSPELYDLKLEFVTGGTVSAVDDVTFGIRQIDTYMTQQGHKGFILNGKKVLIKSAGWTDDIFLRDTPESNERQLLYVKDMNMNMVRFENVWGNSRNLYELCDRYGLMALVGWSCQWEWEVYIGTPDDEYGSIRSEHDMELLTRFLHDQITWLRNHPSIIAWMVGSDKLPRPELEKKYLAIYPQIEDRPYLGAAKGLVSEFSGATGMKMAGPYEYVGPSYWFLDSIYGGAYGFNTETGIGAQLPVYESILKMIPTDKLWPVNDTWSYHCTTSGTAMNTLDILTEVITHKYGKATDLKDYLRKADLANYESTKSMFEAFRVNRDKATGIVQWMLNSAWPSFYWQVYDYYMIPTAAYYGIKKGNLPQQLIYNYKDNGIYAVNSSLSDANHLKAVVKGYDIHATLLYSNEVNVSIPANSSQWITEIENTAKNSFVVLELLDQENNKIADNFYCLSSVPDIHDWENTDWVYTPMKSYSDFKTLSGLPETELKINVSKGGDQITVELENISSQIALFTSLLLKDNQGEIIYPVFWEDNYIPILPGEKKSVKCHFDKKKLNADMVSLTVRGWNLSEQTVTL